mmetsp:Transcript_8452/g.18219  ORF Transcript_8452/g.18219 Transcript_8452/m.18219 type:complete len:294 (-) Transcript_8452:1147-2028(-)
MLETEGRLEGMEASDPSIETDSSEFFLALPLTSLSNKAEPITWAARARASSLATTSQLVWLLSSSLFSSTSSSPLKIVAPLEAAASSSLFLLSESDMALVRLVSNSALISLIALAMASIVSPKASATSPFPSASSAKESSVFSEEVETSVFSEAAAGLESSSSVVGAAFASITVGTMATSGCLTSSAGRAGGAPTGASGGIMNSSSSSAGGALASTGAGLVSSLGVSATTTGAAGASLTSCLGATSTGGSFFSSFLLCLRSNMERRMASFKAISTWSGGGPHFSGGGPKQRGC